MGNTWPTGNGNHGKYAPSLSLRCSTLSYGLHGFSGGLSRTDPAGAHSSDWVRWNTYTGFLPFLFHSLLFLHSCCPNHVLKWLPVYGPVSRYALPEKSKAKITSCIGHILSSILDSLRVMSMGLQPLAHGKTVANTIRTSSARMTPWHPPWCEPGRIWSMDPGSFLFHWTQNGFHVTGHGTWLPQQCQKRENNVNWKNRRVDSLWENCPKGNRRWRWGAIRSIPLPPSFSWVVQKHSFLCILFGDDHRAERPAVSLCDLWSNSWHGNTSPYIYFPSFSASLTVWSLHFSMLKTYLKLVF